MLKITDRYIADSINIIMIHVVIYSIRLRIAAPNIHYTILRFNLAEKGFMTCNFKR